MKQLIPVGVLLHCLGLQAQGLQEQFWAKHNHYPPFDIRVSINGQPVVGEFHRMREAALRKTPPDLAEVIYFAPEGVSFDLKVEVSPRDQQQWKDVTSKVPRLQNIGGVEFRYDDRRKAMVADVVGNGATPQDYGFSFFVLSYSPRADESTMDVVYLYIGQPASPGTSGAQSYRALPVKAD